MLYVVFLITFFIQFLVVLGVLMFVILLARPEVPLSGNKSLRATIIKVQGVPGGDHNPDQNSASAPPPRCRFSMIQ